MSERASHGPGEPLPFTRFTVGQPFVRPGLSTFSQEWGADGPYTGGTVMLAITRFTVGQLFPVRTDDHFLIRKPIFSKPLKDTRLANDFWLFARFDRFDIRVFLSGSSPLGSHLPTFINFLLPFVRNPGKTRGLWEGENGVKERLRTLRGVCRQF